MLSDPYIFALIYLFVFAVVLCVLYYFRVYRKKGLKNRCSDMTFGEVVRYSHIAYNDIHLPVVHYKIDGQIYEVVGPKFSGVMSTTVTTPFTNTKTNFESNFTDRDHLPQVIKIKYHKNSVISVTESPLKELYPIGAKDVKVFYNPDKPHESFVERPKSAKGLGLIFIFGLVIIAVFLF